MGQAMYATVTIEPGYSGQIATATLSFVEHNISGMD